MTTKESCDECGYHVETTKKELLCTMPKSVCFGKHVAPSHKCQEYETRNADGTPVDSKVMKAAFNHFGENRPKCVSG